MLLLAAGWTWMGLEGRVLDSLWVGMTEAWLAASIPLVACLLTSGPAATGVGVATQACCQGLRLQLLGCACRFA